MENGVNKLGIESPDLQAFVKNLLSEFLEKPEEEPQRFTNFGYGYKIANRFNADSSEYDPTTMAVFEQLKVNSKNYGNILKRGTDLFFVTKELPIPKADQRITQRILLADIVFLPDLQFRQPIDKSSQDYLDFKASLRKEQLNSISVIKTPNQPGKFSPFDGHLRVEAMLENGAQLVQVDIYDISFGEARRRALAENFHRFSLTKEDIGAKFYQLNQNGMSYAEIAVTVDMDKSNVQRHAKAYEVLLRNKEKLTPETLKKAQALCPSVRAQIATVPQEVQPTFIEKVVNSVEKPTNANIAEQAKALKEKAANRSQDCEREKIEWERNKAKIFKELCQYYPPPLAQKVFGEFFANKFYQRYEITGDIVRKCCKVLVTAWYISAVEKDTLTNDVVGALTTSLNTV